MGGPSRRSGVSDRKSWGACLHFHVTQLPPGELNLSSARPSNVSSLCFLDPEGGNMSPPLPASEYLNPQSVMIFFIGQSLH